MAKSVDAAAFRAEAGLGMGVQVPLGAPTSSKGSTMAIQRVQMKRLEDERARLAAEIEAKKHELAGLDRALALLRQDESELEPRQRRPRVLIKDIVLGLLSGNRELGLTAAEVVELGQVQGQALDRGSVSSLLSRLKAEGLLSLDGSKYRIATDNQSLPAPGSDSPQGGEAAAVTAAANPRVRLPLVRPALVRGPAPGVSIVEGIGRKA